jgi:branched-chain amino acid transport system ATP-binding protein
MTVTSSSLVVSELCGGYSQADVLRNVGFEVAAGERVALLGANGAGKTAVLRALSGLLTRVTGSIRFGDVDLMRLRAHRRVEIGICHVLQGRQLFSGMTVEENLRVAYLRPGDRVEDRLALVLEVFPALGAKLGDRSSDLSGGQQQMVAVGRALMSRPSLIVLDEPTVGLSPKMVDEMYVALSRLTRIDHAAMLLVEQNASLAMGLADRLLVLQRGQIVLTGTPSSLTQAQLVAAYLT